MERLNKENESEFMKGIRCLNHQEQLKRLFLLSAALVLEGIKPSALICTRHCYKYTWQERKNVFPSGRSFA